MPLRQQPISFIGSYENVRVVDSIVAESEIGQFYSSALLIDQVLRDARIYSVLQTRILGLIGKELELEPAKDTAQGRKIAEDIDADWCELCPNSALIELLTWGLMQGVGLAQVIKQRDLWTLDVWHPYAITWSADENSYYVQVRAEGWVASRVKIIPDGKGGYTDSFGTQWVLFTPYGYGNAGRRGLLRNLHHLFLERQWSHRDRARYSEVFGQPIRFGIAPISASAEDREKYEERLSLAAAEAVIVGAQGEPGNQWDLKLIEAAGKSTDLFDKELTQLDREIATLFLGQSQSVDGQAGLGSNDQAGEPVRIDIMRSDEKNLSDALRAQYLYHYCEYTYGAGDMAPWPHYQVEPPEDTAKKATEFKTIMEALQIAQAMGAPVDMREVLDAFNIPMLTEEEQAALEAEKQQKLLDQQQAMQQQAPNNPPNGANPNQNGTPHTGGAYGSQAA